MKEVNKYIDKIKKLCIDNNVKSLFAFGSVINDKLRADSDIDFVVDIDDKDPLSYSDKYFNLKFNLEEIFKRKIDLLEMKAIKNKFLKQEIEKTKLPVYGE
ncbi:nucleotidyltransferase domain-containing protein [Marivirga sp.]|uniref:nucleotidyltransferase domain-containing protein n=1 Tax=Marivirga sp. TaxID=2018662 RepID=UPI0025E8E4D0|nr:nucleotidyltransferase domain-containing protein [Marivirga sp.]